MVFLVCGHPIGARRARSRLLLRVTDVIVAVFAGPSLDPLRTTTTVIRLQIILGDCPDAAVKVTMG